MLVDAALLREGISFIGEVSARVAALAPARSPWQALRLDLGRGC
jgi:hypothetical protein